MECLVKYFDVVILDKKIIFNRKFSLFVVVISEIFKSVYEFDKY